jgi:hypothetical protein
MMIELLLKPRTHQRLADANLHTLLSDETATDVRHYRTTKRPELAYSACTVFLPCPEADACPVNKHLQVRRNLPPEPVLNPMHVVRGELRR